jgi:hypothetical protein
MERSPEEINALIRAARKLPRMSDEEVRFHMQEINRRIQAERPEPTEWR